MKQSKVKSYTARVVGIFLSILSLGAVLSCSDKGEEKDVSSATPLTSNAIREIGLNNFIATNKPDIQLLKQTWCHSKLDRFKTDAGVHTDNELQQLLSVPEERKPRNPHIVSVTDIKSRGAEGEATIMTTVEVPQNGAYKRQESTDRLFFRYEENRWKLCSDADGVKGTD